MNIGQRIRTGTKWLVLGNTGSRILQFCFGVALARLLFPEDFGLMITVQVFTGFVTMLTTVGLGQALIRAKGVSDADFHAVFTLQLVMGIFVYLGFFLSAPWFAEFFDNPVYKDLMRVTTIIFLIKPFRNMHVTWLNREMDFKKRTVILVITGTLTGAASVLMALAGMGVWSLVLSGLLGAICQNVLFARVTPLSPRLNFEFTIMRKHSNYGSKVLANDFLSYIRREAINLILSKLAGPAFLGLFNKANSLHRTPYQMFGQPVAQPVFRAMSKVQDDLDQTKYMFYRMISLLMVYVMPFFIGLWWVAEPFVGVVYGEKWLPAVEPLRILCMAGFFYIIQRPCGVLLMAQNRLVQEMILHTVVLVFSICACLIGLGWGLEGVAWGLLTTQIFSTMYFYILAYQTIPTRVMDLFKAIAPGVQLNFMLFIVLALTDFLSSELLTTNPVLYLLLMSAIGALIYLSAFLLLPMPGLASERMRWLDKLSESLNLTRKFLTRSQ